MFIPDIPSIIKSQLPDLYDLDPLAHGGQKAVFRAKHVVYQDVVFKLLLDSDERTQREIEVATQYQFSNVPKVYESGTISFAGAQSSYLLEAYVQGETLRTRLSRGKVSLSTNLNLIRTLLTISTETEKRQLVHRDIKPENLILGSDGNIWLIDFGIARHLSKASITATGARFGPCTVGYAAPEQFRNMKSDIDIRADLFSIGVVAYESFTGQNPFKTGARDDFDVLRRTESVVLKPLNIQGDKSNELSQFISTLMDKYPSRRPRTAQQALNWFIGLLSTIKNGNI
jgi:serine/threonine protein kinase